MAGGSRSSGRNFYPRPPRGGRLGAAAQIGEGKVDFYPRPPRGGRRGEPWHGQRRPAISIHALREEGDRGLAGACSKSQISIHALREEGDQDGQAKANRAAAISIHALREEGDRRTFLNLDEFGEFLSTPSARRATAALEKQEAPEPISIHALREEGDKAGSCDAALLSPISIHALREEGDRGAINKRRNEQYFYPRPPRGGRLNYL